ncbi:ssl1498 family light-harvesting-like protein [Aphanizomenon sp. PH219]|nr:ssl1498 family light-harvesting-like protein [Aphanizomenon sp. 202]MDK2459670.1 ssl1498 family light-harvesting-like protein [Aphanizomenon sp. PH219]
MYTTTDEKGILNNYAEEPRLYHAKFPSKAQQNKYAFQGAVAILLLTSIVLITLGVS